MAYLLHQLLIRSAERHADQVAVCHENRSMTYRELETAPDLRMPKIVTIDSRDLQK